MKRGPIILITWAGGPYSNNCGNHPHPPETNRSDGFGAETEPRETRPPRSTRPAEQQRTDQIETVTGRERGLLAAELTEVDWASERARWSGRRWRRGTARSWACGCSSLPRPGRSRSRSRERTWRWCWCTPTPSSAACRACCAGWRRASLGAGTPPSPSTCAAPAGPRGGRRSRAPPRSGTSSPSADGSQRTSNRAASSSSDPRLVGFHSFASPWWGETLSRSVPFLFSSWKRETVTLADCCGNQSNWPNDFALLKLCLVKLNCANDNPLGTHSG